MATNRYWPFGVRWAFISSLIMVPALVALAVWLYRPAGPLATRLTFAPLLVAVLKPGRQASKAELLAWLKERIAKWWLPDDVVFLREIPHTATGKILKTQLRVLLRDFTLNR